MDTSAACYPLAAQADLHPFWVKPRFSGAGWEAKLGGSQGSQVTWVCLSISTLQIWWFLIDSKIIFPHLNEILWIFEIYKIIEALCWDKKGHVDQANIPTIHTFNDAWGLLQCRVPVLCSARLLEPPLLKLWGKGSLEGFPKSKNRRQPGFIVPFCISSAMNILWFSIFFVDSHS